MLLGIIAYNLGNLLRRLVLPVAIQSWSLTSLQQRLFKTGGRLIRHARYFILQLAQSQLTQRPVCTHHPAQRAARVATDVIESSTPGADAMRSGAEAAEVSLNRAVGLTKLTSARPRTAHASRAWLPPTCWKG